MVARILSTAAFWLLMAILIPGALLFVIFAYLPFVALKAVWLAATGNLHSTTAGPSGSVART